MVDKKGIHGTHGSLSAASESGLTGGLAPVPPVGGFTHGQVMSLLLAGRMLQAGTWPGGRVKIAKVGGETYPVAAARAIGGLTESERDRLRELVSWVRDYERHEE